MEAAGPRNGHSSFPKFFIASAAAGATLYWLAGKSAAATTLATQTTAAAASTGVGASLLAPCQIAPATFVATPVASTGFSASLLAAGKTFALAHPYIMVITAVAIGIFCLGKGIQMYQRHQAEVAATKAAEAAAVEKAEIPAVLKMNLEDLKLLASTFLLSLPKMKKIPSPLLDGHTSAQLEIHLVLVKENIKTALHHYLLDQNDQNSQAVHELIEQGKQVINQFDQIMYLHDCNTRAHCRDDGIAFTPTYPDMWQGQRNVMSIDTLQPSLFHADPTYNRATAPWPAPAVANATRPLTQDDFAFLSPPAK